MAPHTRFLTVPRATRIAKNSCVNSSMTLSIRNLLSVVRPVLDEVVGPDVVVMLGPQPDARSVRQPEPSAFGLLPGDLQPLASPNPLDPLVVDEPACSAQQLGDLAVAVASVLPSKLDDVALSRSSSSRPRGTLRCVERCWPSAAQARRSDTPSSRRTCSMQTRRRAGLRSFPGLPPAGSACPASGRQSLCAAACSQSRDPSVA